MPQPSSSQLAASAVETLQRNETLVLFPNDGDLQFESSETTSVGVLSSCFGGRLLFLWKAFEVNMVDLPKTDQPADVRMQLKSQTIHFVSTD